MEEPAKTGRFGKALERLRDAEKRPYLTIREQLRLLDDGPVRPRAAPHLSAMPLPEGTVERNGAGAHYVVRKSYPDDHFHGKVRLNRSEAPDFQRLLELARNRRGPVERERIAFLDTETTGVSGGAGMCPFLVGIGYFRDDAFHLEQRFMRDFDEEASMLAALGESLQAFDVLVTYNGQTFDAPIVENRCVLARLDSPFAHMAHFDLLFMARRLWRAGHGSCKLTALERELLNYVRGPDIPGAMIPRAYFDYLRSSDAVSLRSVFTHHAADILSLAALTIHAADRVVDEPQPLDDALDLYSLGRIFDQAREDARGARCYEMALAGGVPMPEQARAMERLSVLYRKRGDVVRSMELCGRLMNMDEFSAAGYEGAAMLEEHHERNLDAACAVVRDAMRRLEGRPGAERTVARLNARLDRLERKQQKELFAAAGK